MEPEDERAYAIRTKQDEVIARMNELYSEPAKAKLDPEAFRYVFIEVIDSHENIYLNTKYICSYVPMLLGVRLLAIFAVAEAIAWFVAFIRCIVYMSLSDSEYNDFAHIYFTFILIAFGLKTFCAVRYI